MNANDLMINDYLRYKGCIGRVSAVFKDCDISSNYEAIPITAEILEASGFEVEETKGWWKTWKAVDKHLNSFHLTSINCINGGYDWFIYHDGKKVEVAHFQYVHEIQHAMRLMGLNDLADNLKVV